MGKGESCFFLVLPKQGCGSALSLDTPWARVISSQEGLSDKAIPFMGRDELGARCQAFFPLDGYLLKAGQNSSPVVSFMPVSPDPSLVMF